MRIDMCRTCIYAQDMSKMIQVRNVPERIHATLKARAAMAGMSLSEFLLEELRRVAEMPTSDEIAERLAARRPVRMRTSAAAAVRAERDSR